MKKRKFPLTLSVSELSQIIRALEALNWTDPQLARKLQRELKLWEELDAKDS